MSIYLSLYIASTNSFEELDWNWKVNYIVSVLGILLIILKIRGFAEASKFMLTMKQKQKIKLIVHKQK